MLDGVDNNFRRNGLITLRPVGGGGTRVQDPDQPVPGGAGTESRRDDQCDHQVGIERVSRQRLRIFPEHATRRQELFHKARLAESPVSAESIWRQPGRPDPHDKLFFFADYEGFRKRQGTFASVNTVPTAAMREGDFSGVRDYLRSVHGAPRPGNRERLHARSVSRKHDPKERFDSVTSRRHSGVSAPDNSGLANNQITNPVQGQDWDQGDIRVD